MNWWRTLRESRRLPPQTVESVELGERVEVSEPLRSWLESAFSGGEGAAEREAEALARLRSEPERSLSDIVMAYDRAREEDYPLRWALVYGAGQLGVRDGLAFLERVVASDLPPERSSDIHHSTVAEETSLRCQAVRGIAALASRADDLARESLLAQLSHPSLTVRVIACQVARDLELDPVKDEEIRQRLPAEDAEHLLSIRRVSVDELEPLLSGTARVTAPRPPGGESGAELNLGATKPPTAGREEGGHG